MPRRGAQPATINVMGLLPKPHATLTDADVADALGRAVAVIDPLLDLLAQADPIGLRARSRRVLAPPRRLVGWLGRLRHRAPGQSTTERALNAGAHLLNAADLPGTAAWDRLDRDERVHWWVHRVGALATVAVASPGAFGWLTRVVPVSELAGFISDAIVLCALAREYGVTDRKMQVQLLAAVLCRRTLPDDVEVPPVSPQPLPDSPPPGWRPLAAITSAMPVVAVKTVWQLAGILRATFTEVGKRPQPKKRYRRLGALPGIGAIATYFGERDALVRAAGDGVAWLDAHRADRDAATPGEAPPGVEL